MTSVSVACDLGAARGITLSIGGVAVAVDLSLPAGSLEAESAEEALAFAQVDPSRLSAEGRDQYARQLVRIGLWSDARVVAAPPSVSDGERDSCGDEGTDEP
jgi:hypothetical protein